jgi:hypothetical protein
MDFRSVGQGKGEWQGGTSRGGARMGVAQRARFRLLPRSRPGGGGGGAAAGGGRLAGRSCFQGLGFGRWLFLAD